MDNILDGFPITGAACCVVLSQGSTPSEIWTLTRIETLSNSDEGRLASLWRETRGKSIEITTKDLCDALIIATQVIDLDIRSAENPNKELFIEDGELIERRSI
ncbi:hypothetical protein GCM10027276_31190 [Comamonas piscis]